ncbi:manganese efflux pump [Yoonia sp.]|uniref:manganese efflux pump MntP n=1 Tax=Yoonia sp. TaxID=2212373 RepID=UPI0019E4E0C5|nr:manganese efflux pump [Yoonia sp.]MBE0412303.1 manganese efflux pump [Yoonia sp.]
MVLELILLGVVIGANNFATALMLGALGHHKKRWRIIITFAMFEFWVPLIGLWIGRTIATLVAFQVGWIGPVLLACLGVWMLTQAGRQSADDRIKAKALTGWGGLLALSALLSLDNLIIGFSLGFSDIPALVVAVVIMMFSVAFSWIGLKLGNRAKGYYATLAEIGCALLLLGMAGVSLSGRV